MLVPCLLALSLGWAEPPAEQQPYDPLALPTDFEAKPLDLTVHDAQRDRDVPLRVRLPNAEGPAPVLLFSHGLGGNKEGGTYLAEHWAARGYVTANLQHPGSDDAVWRDAPLGRRLAAMKQAASAGNLQSRIADVQTTLDQLKIWNEEQGHPLFGRLDLGRVGMSGHSFGAVTTQHVSGQSLGRLGPQGADPRIDAAVALSPSAPSRGTPAEAFGEVAIPWLLMTGTKDDGAGVTTQTPESRRQVFPALPPTIDRYQLVLKDAEHHAFADVRGGFGQRTRNPNHHWAIRALTTAFWDAHLRADPAAKSWLHGEGANGVLEKGDEWQARPAGK
ncbi:alpha/beta hydrolase family protein [Alienimonas californiensis]|uniref:Alpha/beta hydrolase family protein n=1 Tax=Alienimonas californiensis TaxID=2527989 RepID=A0A517P6Z8_9PLAN|nr:dienelactone hydrolase [Alienimonas californiensis]QDT15158.1 Alpha/beta hydrolase family protein [Alienimonas californiensis]